MGFKKLPWVEEGGAGRGVLRKDEKRKGVSYMADGRKAGRTLVWDRWGKETIRKWKDINFNVISKDLTLNQQRFPTSAETHESFFRVLGSCKFTIATCISTVILLKVSNKYSKNMKSY